jgi:hypothetical protein
VGGAEMYRDMDDLLSAGPLHASQSSSNLRSSDRLAPSPPGSPTASLRRKGSAAPVTPAMPEPMVLKLPDDPAQEPPLWCERPASKSVVKTLGKSEIKRQEIIYELVQTEKGFVRHLTIIQQLFRQPLVDEALLTPEQLHTLFNNLTEIIDMNTAFCRSLTQTLKDSDPHVTSFGPLFLEAFSKLNAHAFAVFCANQNCAIAFYRERRRTYASFNTRMATSESHPACERLTLVDYLVKPLQRLTKYPLLLKASMLACVGCSRLCLLNASSLFLLHVRVSSSHSCTTASHWPRTF